MKKNPTKQIKQRDKPEINKSLVNREKGKKKNSSKSRLSV